jgi:hypothetical protein
MMPPLFQPKAVRDDSSRRLFYLLKVDASDACYGGCNREYFCHFPAIVINGERIWKFHSSEFEGRVAVSHGGGESSAESWARAAGGLRSFSGCADIDIRKAEVVG